MYAIIKTGGQQFKVAPGDVLHVDRLHVDEGSTITFEPLLVSHVREGEAEDVTVGFPTVSGATVKAEVVRHLRGKKVVVFKYKRRKNYRKKKGFRAELTELKISEVNTANA